MASVIIKKHTLKATEWVNRCKSVKAYQSIDECIRLLSIERQCVERADKCDRDCANCELVQDTDELLSMYENVIALLTEIKKCKDNE